MDPATIRETGRVPHGGESDTTILDFSANVNPQYPDGVVEIYERALEESRRYPDDAYPDFRAAAADYVGCEPDDVVPMPGGLAAIRLAIETTVEPGDDVLIPAPSFGEYAREVRLQGARPRFVPHDEVLDVASGGDFEANFDSDSDSEITLGDVALAVVCTPNNPTGEAADPTAIRAFAERCETADVPVLVDEAFLGFTDLPSAATFDLDHVIVVRSLTKLFGLPGLRAGFAVASGDYGDALRTARPAWNLGTPAARVGVHCLRDAEFVRETCERVARERERMREILTDGSGDRRGFEVFPSDAPYLLLDCGERSVDSVVDGARRDGIAIRDARTFRGLDSHVRVAVKDREANDRLLAALTGIDGSSTGAGGGA